MLWGQVRSEYKRGKTGTQFCIPKDVWMVREVTLAVQGWGSGEGADERVPRQLLPHSRVRRPGPQGTVSDVPLDPSLGDAQPGHQQGDPSQGAVQWCSSPQGAAHRCSVVSEGARFCSLRVSGEERGYEGPSSPVPMMPPVPSPSGTHPSAPTNRSNTSCYLDSWYLRSRTFGLMIKILPLNYPPSKTLKRSGPLDCLGRSGWVCKDTAVGHPGSSAGERLPSAQVVILGSWDRVPCPAPPVSCGCSFYSHWPFLVCSWALRLWDWACGSVLFSICTFIPGGTGLVPQPPEPLADTFPAQVSFLNLRQPAAFLTNPLVSSHTPQISKLSSRSSPNLLFLWFSRF